MKNTFTQRYHLPILVMLNFMVWGMIVLRVYTFWKHHFGRWRSWRTTSIILTVVSGCLLSVYFWLGVAVYTLDQEIYNFYEMPNANGTMRADDPSALSHSEAMFVFKRYVGAVRTSEASRFILTTGLWIVKLSLLAIYLETRTVLKERSRFVLNLTGPIIIGTYVLSFILMIQSTLIGNTNPSLDDIRSGIAMSGISYSEMDDPTEITISLSNIVTDLLLTYIAYKTVTAVHYPVRAGWFLFLMGGITITMAIIRLVFVFQSLFCDDQCMSTGTLKRIGIPIWILAELEAFFGSAVSCLPGLRVMLRRARKDSMEKKLVGGSSGNASSNPSNKYSDVESGMAAIEMNRMGPLPKNL